MEQEAHALKKANELAVGPDSKPIPVNMHMVTVETAKSLAGLFPEKVPETARAVRRLKEAFTLGGDAGVVGEAKKIKAISSAFAKKDPYLEKLLDSVIASGQAPADLRNPAQKLFGTGKVAPPARPRF